MAAIVPATSVIEPNQAPPVSVGAAKARRDELQARLPFFSGDAEKRSKIVAEIAAADSVVRAAAKQPDDAEPPKAAHDTAPPRKGDAASKEQACEPDDELFKEVHGPKSELGDCIVWWNDAEIVRVKYGPTDPQHGEIEELKNWDVVTRTFGEKHPFRGQIWHYEGEGCVRIEYPPPAKLPMILWPDGPCGIVKCDVCSRSEHDGQLFAVGPRGCENMRYFTRDGDGVVHEQLMRYDLHACRGKCLKTLLREIDGVVGVVGVSSNWKVPTFCGISSKKYDDRQVGICREMLDDYQHCLAKAYTDKRSAPTMDWIRRSESQHTKHAVWMAIFTWWNYTPATILPRLVAGSRA